MKILNPTMSFAPEKGKLAPRIETLEGKTIGFLWNAYPGGDRLLKRAEEIVSAKYRLKGMRRYTKSYLGEPAGKEILKKLASDCDVVFTSIGA